MAYNTEIFKDYIGEDTSDYLRIHDRNQESYFDNFSSILPSDKSANILEIGCGAGQLLHYLQKSGYRNIEGIDIGEDQIGFLKKMGIKGTVIRSIPDYLSDKAASYDLIIMNQVLEHIPKNEILESIRSIRKALKNNALFVFATPNMACVSGPFQRYIDFTHEVGFTERSAYQVMRIAGFREISVRGDDVKLKMRPKRIAWWMLNGIWNSMLGFIYFIERGSDRPKVLSRILIVTGKK
jgi:2-polyprenyl-3-methyl-5-hydroxy-6-metoxy-1,4-benzoquinol methylase